MPRAGSVRTQPASVLSPLCEVPSLVLLCREKVVSPDQFHRLEHRCADVAACFEAVLRLPFRTGRRRLRSVPDHRDTTDRHRLAPRLRPAEHGFLAQVRDWNALPHGEYPCKAYHTGEALWWCEQKPLCDALGLRDIYEHCGVVREVEGQGNERRGGRCWLEHAFLAGNFVPYRTNVCSD